MERKRHEPAFVVCSLQHHITGFEKTLRVARIPAATEHFRKIMSSDCLGDLTGIDVSHKSNKISHRFP